MEPVERTELSILSEIGRISTSAIDLDRKLQRIIEVIMRGMNRQGASVFLLDPAGATVTLTAALGLNQETVGKLTFPLGMGIAGWVAQQKVPLALADPFSDPRFAYVPETGIERFKSLVAAPVMDEDRCLGVLFILSSDAWEASLSEITLLTTTANQISGVIRSTQLFENIQARLNELATIHEIGMALTSTLDLGQLLALVSRSATRALGAMGCTIRLANATTLLDKRAPVTEAYVEEAVRHLDAAYGCALFGHTTRERCSILIADSGANPVLQAIPGAPRASVVSVPLLFHDRVIGVITLYNKQDGRAFTENDLRFLTTIASSAAVAIENAVMFDRAERLAEESRSRAQEFSILYDVGTAMSATLNLDRLLRIILTAATMGGSGLGFNRAILFLVNDRTNMLQGMMGVGPSTWEEANQAWAEVARKHKSLMEWIQTGELFESRDSEINRAARSIRVPLDSAENVLVHTVLRKQAINITDAAADPLVKHELRDLLRVNSFATVPLVAKGRVLGVIVVDNMFTQRPITDHDVRFLTMFAQQAALAIDNAMIHSNMETMNKDIRIMHEQLAQSEKMAALGAMMAEITHEIRNPLVSIGGFTRRLAKKVTDPDAKKYIDIVLSEVSRLESIIHDNLAYIKNSAPQLTPGSLNTVVEEVLRVYEDELRQRGIRLERRFDPSIPDAELDARLMTQAVVNLITNAMEAMEQGGVLTVRTAGAPDRSESLLEISDTGSGVSSEAMHNLFNPYYTTKVRGTGLGLPITHRIVKAHRGSIVVRNKEEGGAMFTIRLPWPPQRPRTPQPA